MKRWGGVGRVSEPARYRVPQHARNAPHNVDIDYVVPLAQMGPLLDEITRDPVPAGTVSFPEDFKQEAAIAERVVGNIEAIAQIGHQVPLTCPDCDGTLGGNQGPAAALSLPHRPRLQGRWAAAQLPPNA